jgi:hypothetical protein
VLRGTPSLHQHFVILRKFTDRDCVAIADPNDKDAKISQTTTYCSTCLVPLCNKKIGNRKTTCFERLHQLNDLSQLMCKKDSPSGVKGQSSKKMKASNNNT